jgi:uncharacterized protein (DUF305 family)
MKIGGDASMKNRRIITEILAGAMLVSSFAGIYTVSALTGTHFGGQVKPACGDGFRQAMDDMHRQMHAVKPSGNVDEDFVRLMLPHHQAAIEMAKVELLCGNDEVNRRLAQEIIVDQQSEIDLMRLWLSKHELPKPVSTRPASEDKKP